MGWVIGRRLRRDERSPQTKNKGLATLLLIPQHFPTVDVKKEVTPQGSLLHVP